MVTFVADVEISLTFDELKELTEIAKELNVPITEVVRNSLKHTIDTHHNAKEVRTKTSKRTNKRTRKPTVNKQNK